MIAVVIFVPLFFLAQVSLWLSRTTTSLVKAVSFLSLGDAMDITLPVVILIIRLSAGLDAVQTETLDAPATPFLDMFVQQECWCLDVGTR